MTSPLQITSPKNPRVKTLLELAGARRAREASGLFVVEGAREIDRALRSHFALKELYVCPEALSPAAALLVAAAATHSEVERIDVTRVVYSKIAVREGVDGLVAVFYQKPHELAGLRLPATPLIVAVQGVEKPGNLGALLRSADGAGVDAVVVLDRALDLYNPHVIRASLGTVFSVPVATATSADFRALCRERGIRTYAAALAPEAMVCFAADFRGPVALVLGEEAHGLSADWLTAADATVMIPMRGLADSLNVSTAGAVLMYEAVRQRLA